MHETLVRPSHRTVRWRAGVTLLAPLAIGIVVALAPVLAGCASKSPAEAEDREVRLTSDEVVKYAPRFSPDGAWIAYAVSSGQESGALGVFVISSKGGQSRRISPDSISAYPLGWTSEGAVYCRSMDGHTIYTIGLDGSMKSRDAGDPFARISAVSPDGRTTLLLKFNQDNRDLGRVKEDGEFEFVSPTPAWEEEAVLGPTADDVTVVSTPSYLSQSTTISVWSDKSRSYTALPLPEGPKWQPAWSADGQMMAYSFRRDGQAALWLYDAKNAKSAPLTSGVEDCTSPTWAPDGEWLAFCRSTKVSHIYAGDPKKEGRRQLTEGPDYDFSPVVSPDGEWVAFLRKFAGGEEKGKVALCVVPVAGGEVKRLDLKGLTLPGKGMDAICWSPDSREIGFQASEGAARMDIHRIGRDGQGLARVTVEPGDEIEPRWSQDGRFICYTRVGNGQTRIAVVPASGGLPKIVSQEGVVSEGGLIGPASERLVYATFRPEGVFELWMTSIDQPEKRTRLIKDSQVVWPGRWTPDGKHIILMRGNGSNWHLSTWSVDAGKETKIGRFVMLPSGKDHYPELSPEGAQFGKLLYPGGVVLADGRDRSDLFLIRARMPDKPVALYLGEDRFLCSGFVGLAGCF